MRCADCGKAPPRGAKFCSECGAPIDLRHASPGAAAASSDARQAVVEGELRQLTVVFCDVVGSTSLSAQLEPEELGDVTARYHAEIVEVVERYGGEVVRYLGDGVLVEFGWPVAHGDDCERAVRAAIEIAAAIEIVDHELPPEIPLAARIGIHTGPVLIGELGAGSHRETMALGETMNVAARLQEAAAPGTAVISEASLRLVRGIFVTEELEPRSLRGIDEPFKLHRVVQPAGVPSRFDAAQGRLTRFVGRDSELATVLEGWRGAQVGHGSAVLIRGEPGVGKSRLVHEFRQRVKHTPHSWLECRCSSYTEHSAFGPVVDLVERGLGFHPQDGPERRLAKLERALERTGIGDPEAVAVLSRLFALPVAAGSHPMAPEFQRRRTRELITDWARALARLQPLILLVEDLQWADASTLELFESLIGEAGDTGLLVIATARDEFEPPWPQTALTALELVPLARQEIRALLSSLGEGAELPEALVERVVQDSAGIPLFAEEIGWMLLESDLLEERNGSLELIAPFERLAIPVTLQDSLMARLDGVNVAKRVVQHAAVIGGDFDQDLLEAVAGLRSDIVRDGLARLVEDQLLFRHDDAGRTTYTFKHGLIQEAAYQSLLKRTRKELHARTADVLQTRLDLGEADISPEVIARHYRAAGRILQAVESYRLAARQSALRSGYKDATEHLTRALGLLAELPEAYERRDPARRCELLIGLGDAHWSAGEFAPAREAFLEAAELALQAGLPEQLARAALGFGGRMAFGAGFRDERLIALLEAALAGLSEAHPGLRARVMARLAEALTFSESAERRAALCGEALEIARTLGDPAAVASVLAHEHWALWSPDNLERRLHIAGEIVTLAEEAKDRVLEAEGRLWLVIDLLEASETLAAVREFNTWVALTRQVRSHYQLWTVAVAEAMWSLARGSIAEAESLSQAALEIGQHDGNQNAIQLFGVQIAGVRREQARYEELEEPLKAFVSQFAAIPTWRCALCFLYSESGRHDEARRELALLAADDFAAFRKDHFWLADVTLASDACALIGESEHARVLYEQLLPYARRCIMCGPIAASWGSTSRTLGVLAAILERWEEAERHFEDAVEHNREIGAILWLTRTQLEYATMLATRGAPCDGERALCLLAEVLETSERLGLTDPSEKALALRTHLEARLPQRAVA